MKFCKSLLLTLAAATAVYSLPQTNNTNPVNPENIIPENIIPEDLSSIFKDELKNILPDELKDFNFDDILNTFTNNTIPKNVPNVNPPSEICIAEMLGMSECIGNNPEINNVNDCEAIYNNAKCTALITNTPSQCDTIYKVLISSAQLHFNLMCSKAEDNSYCPVSKLYQTKNDPSELEIVKSVKESCSSKQCIASTKALFESISKIAALNEEDPTSQLAKLKDAVNYELSSCKTENTTDTINKPKVNASTSGAMTNFGKFGLTALLSSVLALLF